MNGMFFDIPCAGGDYAKTINRFNQREKTQREK